MKLYKIWLLSAVLLLANGNLSFAQTAGKHIFQLSKLSAVDTVLNGWLFKTGDKPQYALPAYNDDEWTQFDPGAELYTFKYPGQTCWLRLHLNIDTALQTNEFALMANQNVASQVYVDGKLFKSYGTVSASPVAYNPLNYPENIQLSAGPHVIAVKFILPGEYMHLHTTVYSSNILIFSINKYTNAIKNYQEEEVQIDRVNGENLWLMGIFFILTITHIILYLYHRSQKAHLYYSGITFVLLCDTWLNVTLQTQHSLVAAYWLNNLGNLTFAGFIFLPLTIYAIFGYRNRVVLKLILAISCICLLTMFFNNEYEAILFFYFIPICNAIECIRVAILARKNKQRGAIFIITGSSLFLVLLGLQNSVPGFAGEVLFVLTLLSLPIGMTIFLAIQTAMTYSALEINLAEVQALSDKNLQYQLEKQQLLADQNETLERQVAERTAELSTTLDNLKATQQQLIQAEKMASLGELTAGIAHEIQNPLNFVNNFSEVSIELLDELKQEAETGNKEEVIAIAGDLTQNLEKINHHGRRADAIVKGMLQHSQSGSGTKEPTNINTLSNEYLRLSYHGLRSKDKSFNAETITHFDEELPLIKVVPQDIGRVLLNIFNNAFYAVNKKQKTAGEGYKAEVSVTTCLENGQLNIWVKDNGVGIPAGIKGKIMQPFFTTKPTGEGTGLGLSLTYDIVVNGHGGSITVNSVEGEGSEFIIQLPIV
ncbi:ATP-binding protein [Mucilaginibacter gotjawali]|uniref:histidine kinase n=2 Tax=Mucilaginibacter gotjawali TaxID=1550579 RepID=A0A110B336_9SPHI|nr:ATP-binding protein [Mucilaginibacter gotjawali]MBB3058239.1 signal transduction histidine kinase [Mucilaginibacter gotjawali]BAU54805.1 Sensor protein ZraS [Mucilaginibacter gotjawali]